MATFTAERSIDAPADVVWDVVADPAIYAAVAPNLSTVEIVEGEGEGMVRRCVDTDGNAWTETVHTWKDGREFAVAVDVAGSEFHRRLFDRFEGRWAVAERPGGSLVRMTFDWDAKYGPFGRLVSAFLRYRAPSLTEAIFDGWAAEVDRRLDGADPEASAADAREESTPNELFR